MPFSSITLVPCKKRNELPRYELMELLSYDPETGEFLRLKFASGKILKKPKVAGYINKGPHHGYREIEINHTIYQAHRLAWLFFYGETPPNEIDHINGVPDDNRIENLRLATKSQNQCNRKQQKSGSKFKGVCFDKDFKKWVASIALDKKQYYLGSFNTEIAAAAMRRFYEKRMHGRFARSV